MLDSGYFFRSMLGWAEVVVRYIYVYIYIHILSGHIWSGITLDEHCEGWEMTMSKYGASRAQCMCYLHVFSSIKCFCMQRMQWILHTVDNSTLVTIPSIIVNFIYLYIPAPSFEAISWIDHIWQVSKLKVIQFYNRHTFIYILREWGEYRCRCNS